MPHLQHNTDAVRYQQRYPGKEDHPNTTLYSKNVLFYKGEYGMNGNSREKIDDVLGWRDLPQDAMYDKLERRHDYVQWLFPIRERSMFNDGAQELQLHEIRAMRSDPACMHRLLVAYKMMLAFYGMRMDDETTGHIVRADDYAQRYNHLGSSHHNYLRITRILKCLGEFDMEEFKANFVGFLIHEVFGADRLMPRCRESLENYWVPVLRREDDREKFTRRINDLENLQFDGPTDCPAPDHAINDEFEVCGIPVARYWHHLKNNANRYIIMTIACIGCVVGCHRFYARDVSEY